MADGPNIPHTDFTCHIKLKKQKKKKKVCINCNHDYLTKT